jgi:hypothetical protein
MCETGSNPSVVLYKYVISMLSPPPRPHMVSTEYVWLEYLEKVPPGNELALSQIHPPVQKYLRPFIHRKGR